MGVKFLKQSLGLLLLVMSAASLAQESDNTEIPSADDNSYRLAVVVETIANNLGKPIFTSASFPPYQPVHLYGIEPSQLGYGDLLRILRMQGYTAFESNGAINIIEIGTVRHDAVPTVEPGVDYYPDQYVNKIVTLDKICVGQILPVIRPLVAKGGYMTAVFASNTLILVDNYANIQRVEAVLAQLEEDTQKKQKCEMSSKG